MRHPMRAALLLLSALPLTLTLSSCTTKATLDTTSDGLTNFLSSTTGRSWFTEDGLVRPEHKVTAFVSYNFDNLKQDMAQGQGEYLASLGTLLGVQQDRQAEFFILAREKYPILVKSDRTTPGEMLAALSQELSGHPSLNKLGVKN